MFEGGVVRVADGVQDGLPHACAREGLRLDPFGLSWKDPRGGVVEHLDVFEKASRDVDEGAPELLLHLEVHPLGIDGELDDDRAFLAEEESEIRELSVRVLDTERHELVGSEGQALLLRVLMHMAEGEALPFGDALLEAIVSRIHRQMEDFLLVDLADAPSEANEGPARTWALGGEVVGLLIPLLDPNLKDAVLVIGKLHLAPAAWGNSVSDQIPNQPVVTIP